MAKLVATWRASATTPAAIARQAIERTVDAASCRGADEDRHDRRREGADPGPGDPGAGAGGEWMLTRREVRTPPDRRGISGAAGRAGRSVHGMATLVAIEASGQTVRRRAAPGLGRGRRRPASRPAAPPERRPTRLTGAAPVRRADRPGRRARGADQRYHGCTQGRRAHPRAGGSLGPRRPRPTSASIRPRHRWLACLPLAHVGGLSVVTRAHHTGTPLTVHDGFDPAARRCRRPTPAARTSRSWPPPCRRIDPSAWTCIVLGGSAPPSDRPRNSVATYGLTETGSGVVYDGRPARRASRCASRRGAPGSGGRWSRRADRDGTPVVDRRGLAPHRRSRSAWTRAC